MHYYSQFSFGKKFVQMKFFLKIFLQFMEISKRASGICFKLRSTDW